MWAILGRLLLGLPGLAGGIIEHLNRRSDAALQGFTAGTGADTERLRAYFAASMEANRLKAEANKWWGARLCMLVVGLPASLHFALVMLDSSCPAAWGWGAVPGRGGCGWGIPALPPPYDTYEWAVAQSFVIVAPAMPLASAAAQWLRRAR